jgi:hypothetical protein
MQEENQLIKFKWFAIDLLNIIDIHLIETALQIIAK